MLLNIQQLRTVADELKKLDVELDLSSEQRQILFDFLRQAFERIEEFKSQHPDVLPGTMFEFVGTCRSEVRRRMAHFLTPDQIHSWDAMVQNESEFLGLRTAA